MPLHLQLAYTVNKMMQNKLTLVEKPEGIYVYNTQCTFLSLKEVLVSQKMAEQAGYAAIYAPAHFEFKCQETGVTKKCLCLVFKVKTKG